MGRLLEALFPTPESELRLLILIAAFGPQGMRGRTQLAKTDFFLRYPEYLRRVLEARGVEAEVSDREMDIESRMIRHRYGPWDPQYFAVLGRLVSRRLIEWAPTGQGIGFRPTTAGAALARQLATLDEWQEIHDRATTIARHLNLSGDSLRRLIYQQFPEVVARRIGQEIPHAIET